MKINMHNYNSKQTGLPEELEDYHFLKEKTNKKEKEQRQTEGQAKPKQGNCCLRIVSVWYHSCINVSGFEYL